MMLKLRFTGSKSGEQALGLVALNEDPNPPDLDVKVSSAVASGASALRAPNLLSAATPLEQMRALRSQLVRGKPPRYLPGSPAPGQQ
ncbi:MAG TPA: hypothetical protein VFM15_10830 [Gammaproteobacteria bacterium]|nr:hypothetical protein [Gammaproteobacteria bacterium]